MNPRVLAWEEDLLDINLGIWWLNTFICDLAPALQVFEDVRASFETPDRDWLLFPCFDLSLVH